MRSARPLLRRPVVCGSFVLLLLGCSQHHGGPAAPAAPRVSATDPPDGAASVAPDTVITLTLESPASVLRPEDVVVRDGGNRLPGTLLHVGDTAQWTWTPAFELPRGCRIAIATAQQGTVATFVVRDIVAAASFELPGEAIDAAFSWTGGRRAVHTASGRLFEVTANGIVARFVDLPPGVRTCGEDGFVAEVLDAGVRDCVHGDLQGNVDRVPTPLGVALGENNSSGDVVVFVPDTLGTPSQQGLWRLRRSSLEFELAGPLSLDPVTDEPSIEADGTVSLAYAIPGGLRLSRFPAGDLTGEHHDLMIAGSRPQFAAGDDGRGVLAFEVFEPASPGGIDSLAARAARFAPGVGFDLLPVELWTWPIGLNPPPEYHPFQRVDAVHVGKLGSACVVLAMGDVNSFPTPSTYTEYEAVRIEPDRVGTAVLVTTTLSSPIAIGALAVSPWRAELWGMSTFLPTAGIFLTRLRPDAMVGDMIYQPPATDPFAEWSFAFDDSGRAVVAVVERATGGTLTGSRVVVFE
jgi:hypothetical protein